MIRLAALDNQKSLRDLAGLPRLCDDVAWLDLETLATANEPAIVVGIWLTDEPAAAKQLLARRSESGLTTIVVPRFKAADLRSVLKTPTSVRVKTGEYESFQWNGGEVIAVPGQTVMETTLHASQCGSVAGSGVTVLSYRPHEAAGAIVLCTAGLASRQLGVEVAQQQRLWQLITDRAAAKLSRPAAASELALPTPAANIDELLASGDAQVAAVALAVAVTCGRREPDAVSAAAVRLGFDLAEDNIRRTLARMPEAPFAELEEALHRHGWGSFLRRGRLALAEGGNA